MSGYGGYEYDTANGEAGNQGGGGFMSQPASQNDEAKEKKSRDKQTLVPLTIKQLLGATKAAADDEGFQIDGRELSQVRLVGNVVTVDARDTKAAFEIEDGTGKVSVTLWLNDGGDPGSTLHSRLEKMVAGSYVCVHGQAKEYGGKLTVSAFDMRPVEDHNEVTYHLLEAIYVHAKAQQKAAAPQQAAGGRQSSFGASFAPQTAGVSAGGGGDDDALGLTSLQRRVFDYYTVNGTGDEGCEVNSVAAGLSLDLGTVKMAVDFLASEGHLYSTIDDDHHKSTQEMG